jgi:hypothetical protein
MHMVSTGQWIPHKTPFFCPLLGFTPVAAAHDDPFHFCAIAPRVPVVV